MQVSIMDSDYEVMKQLESLINAYPKHKASCYTGPQQLVDAVRKTPTDIVLIDIDTHNALSAVKIIQTASPSTKIIVMSKDSEKVSECFNHHANGFLIKPIDEAKLQEQLFRVRHPFLARIKYESGRRS